MNKQATVALAIFVKTPGLSPLKTRLANSQLDGGQTLGRIKAEQLYRAFIKATAAMAKKLNNNITVYWAVTEPEAMDDPLWQDFQRIGSTPPYLDIEQINLGHRLAHVYNTLHAQHNGVIIIGSDSPQIDYQTIENTASAIHTTEPSCIFGPSVDGGFYLFASQNDVPSSFWQQCQYSQSDTYANLKRAFSQHYAISELAHLQDIDTLADLYTLREDLQSQNDENSLSTLQRELFERINIILMPLDRS